MNQEKNQFRLEVRKDGLSPMKIDVIDTISVGHDPRNDLVLIGKKIQPMHLLFEVKGENLALLYKGLSNQTFLNNLPLEEGKTYLLDIGDILDLSEAKITILQEKVELHETQKLKPTIFESKKLFDDMTPEMVIHHEEEKKEIKKERTRTNINFKENLRDSQTHAREKTQNFVIKKEKEKFDLQNFLTLWQIKIYSLVTDIFITYLLLVVLLPLVLVDSYAQEVLYYLTEIVFPHQHHSILSFLIAWFMLSFAQTLVFGGTIGQFIVGLRHKTSNSFFRIVLSRMKTFLFSLVLLPAQNSYKTTLTYKAIRRGLIVVLAFILLSPFLLPPPYNAQVTLLEDLQTKKELHTQTIQSTSADLSMTLSTELPFRYFLLPIVTGGLKKRAFSFTDLKTNESIIVEEKFEFSYKELQARLEYGNPLYRTIRSKDLSDSPLDVKKEVLSHILLSSPVKLKETMKALGPFFGSAVLVKNTLLNKNPASNIVLKTYRPQTPLIYISSSQQDFFYLFENERLSRFVVTGGKNKLSLTEAFEQMVLKSIVTIPEDSKDSEEFKTKKISILEAQDAFLHGDEKTVLTYYSSVATSLSNAKIIYEDVDLTKKAKLALKANIEIVLKFITDRSVEKSLSDIKNQLTPMEKPGGNDE